MIKLYYEPQFRPDKNMYVDDLAAYLADITPLWEVNDFQYVKHDLDITIKLNWNQEGTSDLPFNYAVIENEGEEPFYYWIVDSKWAAQQTLSLRLSMDTVNSLGQGDYSLANPRNLSEETQITRQHMDRYEKQFYWNPALGGTLTRSIHRDPEGLVITQEKVDDVIITDNKNPDIDWYLVYYSEGTEDENKVIKTYLIPETQIPYETESGESFVFDASNMVAGTYELDVDHPFSITIYNEDNSTQDYNTDEWYYWPDNYQTPTQGTKWISRIGKARFTKTSSNLLHMVFDPQGWTGLKDGNMLWVAGIPWLSYPDVGDPDKTIRGFSINSGSVIKINGEETDIVNAKEKVDSYILGIDSLNRLDPRLVKIIKLPYCPVQFYKISPLWGIATAQEGLPGFLLYKGNGLPDLGSEGFAEIDMTAEMRRVVGANDIRPDSRKNPENESKLYHSEFHTVKAVYDSFSYPIDMERFSYLQPSTESIPVSFKPTSTINSKMGFKFYLENIGTYSHDKDWGPYMLVSRNNEDLILNSEYINYIKNGYNYDKKANALAMENQTLSTLLGAGVTVAGTAAAIGSAFAGPVGVVSAIGLGATAVSSAASTIGNVASLTRLQETQDNSMKQKLAQLKAQSASVAGTDDVDLMTWYSDNRLHLMRYDLPDYARNTVYDYFDMVGYKVNLYETPNVDSRIWYNFLQCNPVFKQQGTGKLKQAWLDDLRNRYMTGVTIFHNRDGVYNFEQRYENWEKWITDGSDLTNS